MKPKMVAIVGPTASGKSDLGVELAKKFNGEIISADSRQVYRDMDIGTGKITSKEMSGVHHYMIDVASPKRSYNISRYQAEAQKAVRKILRNQKLPIIVGGTGFYLRSIVDGLVLPAVEPNHKLRRELEKLPTEKLFEKLKHLDEGRAETIDRHNPRRLIRAIEIASALGRVPTLASKNEYDTLLIGINIPPTDLKQKILLRLKKRIRQGMIAEVKKLRLIGLSWKRLESLGLEYRYVAYYLQKKISRQEMIQQLNEAICQYAKRQLTWFNKDKRIIWIKDLSEAEAVVKNFLRRKNP